MPEPYIYKGTVVNVVDGDTIDIQVDLGFHTTMLERFRLLRVNAPEMHGDSREAGLKAKQYVESVLLHKEVLLRSVKTDGFRRWLADVWYTDVLDNQVNISDDLLYKGLAVPFMG